MEKAISETKRRREIQEAYNEEHGITPQTILKEVSGGVIETLRGAHGGKRKKEKVKKLELSPEAIDQKIIELKKEMKLLSKELKFEEAAKVRDEIKSLNEARLLF